MPGRDEWLAPAEGPGMAWGLVRTLVRAGTNMAGVNNWQLETKRKEIHENPIYILYKY